MKKVSVISAIVLGILDAALAVGIVFMILQFRSAGGSETALGTGFESNAEEYLEQDAIFDYDGSLQAEGYGMSSMAGAANEPVPTITPGREPTPGDGGVAMPADDFIFPDSCTQLITQEEMEQKLTSGSDCQRAVNEIYARHGYLFHEDKNPVDYQYFNSKTWYQALEKVDSQEKVRNEFNSIEIANVDALMAFKEAKGWS